MEEILNECVDRLAAGEELEAILQDYPEQADTLRGLLQVGEMVHQAVYPQADVAAAQQRVINYVMSRKKARRPRRLLWMVAAIAGVLLVSVFLFRQFATESHPAQVTAVAAQPTATKDSGSLIRMTVTAPVIMATTTATITAMPTMTVTMMPSTLLVPTNGYTPGQIVASPLPLPTSPIINLPERQIIKVVDADGLPVIGAAVRIYEEDDLVTVLRTQSNGHAVFLPDVTQGIFNVYIEKSISFVLDLGEPQNVWRVVLDQTALDDLR